MVFLVFSLYHGKEETGDGSVTRRRDRSKHSRSSSEMSEEPNARSEGRPEAKTS